MEKVVVNLASKTVETVQMSAEEIAEIQAIPVPATPPLSCSPWQIRKALAAVGAEDSTDYRALIEAYVAAQDVTTRDGWEFASSFVETDPFVQTAKTALGWTDEKLRHLFEVAVTL